MTNIKDIIGKEILFFDGGTGSLLQAQGLIPGELPETWNITYKEQIITLHYNYFRSGANIIKTNTFGANSLKFPVGKAFTKEGFALKKSSQQEQNLSSSCGCGCHNHQQAETSFQPECEDFTLEQIISAALDNANQARSRIEADSISPKELENLRNSHLVPAQENPACRHHFIALDIGPAGKLLEPLGDLSFDAAVELFAQVIRCAIPANYCTGAQLPFDLVLIETMNDCYEAKAAVIAAKEVMEETGTSFPIFVTTVYDESAKSLTGSDPQTMITILEGLGVSGLGMNCSLGPVQMAPIVDMLVQEASTPLIVNPNAGLPRSEDGRTVYDISPEQFAQIVSGFVDKGVAIVGG